MNPTLDFLEQAEKQIRNCLMTLRPKLLEGQGTIEHHFKSDKSVVTEMDTFTETELAKALGVLDPSIPFGGEEGGVDFSRPTFWLADPIDGTEAFIRGIPFATNMVTLIDDGMPVFSVIYNFTLDEFYVAVKGHGATCNGHPIHVSDRPMDRAWIVLSEIKQGNAHALEDALHDRILRIRKFGATGQQMTYIATGAMEGAIHYYGSGHEWDFAPGALLISEAGGRIANIGADTYDYRNFNFIAANPVIFDELMECVVQVDHDAKNPTN